LLLIGGEAGIGKTALAEALESEAAARGALVLRGHCYDLIETPPYGPWTELLDCCPPLPDLPPRPALLGASGPSGTSEPPAARFSRLRDFLLEAAAARPIVLVLEDLHWADPASLELLRFLARELAGAALLLMVTYRAEELHRRHPLYALLPNLVREARAARLDLRPLGDDDMYALVRARRALTAWDEARLVAHLRDRAGGNPFYAGELLRALEEEGMLRPAPAGGDSALWMLGDLTAVRVPALLRQVIDGRLMRLGEDAYRLLGLAATIGQEAPLALWRAVVDSSDDMLADVVERAMAAHLLAETADGLGVRFAHALIREALYEGVPLPRRQAWHRRIGEALLSSPAPDPDAIASHFRLADDARAADWLVRAGERAQRAYAWATAIERFAAGLALLEARNADRTQRAWLHLRLGLLLRYTDPPRAVAALEDAQRLSAGTGDALLVAAATCYAGHLRCWSGDLGRGVLQMAEGVATLDALPPADRTRFARLLADGTTGVLADNAVPQAILAQWLAIVGRYAEARQAADAVLALEPDSDGSPGASSASFYDAYHALGYVHAAQGRPREARRYWRRSQTWLRAIGHHAALHQQLYVELSAAVLPYQTDRLPERSRLAAELDAARRAARGVWREEDEPACLALWFIEGRWADIRGVVAVPESFRALDVTENPAVATLGRAQGEVTLAWRLVREELPHGPETLPETARRFLSGTQLLRLASHLTLDAEDLDAAYRWLEAHDRWLAWSGAVLGHAEGHLTWAAFHRAAGDPAAARRAVPGGRDDTAPAPGPPRRPPLPR
jgi:tetratricopeptide (TPR) repeat protein